MNYKPMRDYNPMKNKISEHDSLKMTEQKGFSFQLEGLSAKQLKS